MQSSGLKVEGYKNVVMITGLPRSGTTLLSAIFASCDNTVSLAEPFLQYLQSGAFRWKDLDGNEQVSLRNPSHFITSIIEKRKSIKVVAFKETWRSKNHDVFPSSDFISNNQQSGMSTIVIVRDPRAIYFSFLNRFMQDNSSMPSELFLSEWDSFVRWSVSSGSLVVRYEDLVVDPIGQMKQIFDELRIDCSFPSLELDSFPGLGDERALAGGRINTQSLYKFLQLDRRVIDKIEDACREGMEKFGYAPINEILSSGRECQ